MCAGSGTAARRAPVAADAEGLPAADCPVTEAGDEVDLVLERDDGQVIAIEIKAGSRISGEDFRGLRHLKERLGPRLEEAIILYTGEHAYTHDSWITILPLDRLWTST